MDRTDVFLKMLGTRSTLPTEFKRPDDGFDSLVVDFNRLSTLLASRLRNLRSSAEANLLSKDIAEIASIQGADQRAQHMKQVVSMLFERLHDAVAKVQKSEATRLNAQLAQQKHFAPGAAAMERAVDELRSFGAQQASQREASDSPEAQEAQALLAAYSSNLDEVVGLQRRLAETAAVLDVLAVKVAEQAETATSILATAEESTLSVDSAAEQLKKAKENSASWRFWLTMWFFGSGLVLLILDTLF
jgi:hypothetical protein